MLGWKRVIFDLLKDFAVVETIDIRTVLQTCIFHLCEYLPWNLIESLVGFPVWSGGATTNHAYSFTFYQLSSIWILHHSIYTKWRANRQLHRFSNRGPDNKKTIQFLNPDKDVLMFKLWLKEHKQCNKKHSCFHVQSSELWSKICLELCVCQDWDR